MVDSVLRAVERYDMLQSGDSIVVGLSGGADSVSLLHVLNSINEKYNLNIYAAHLNHMLRGEEAERDEAFCKILCEKYNIPLYVRRADIRALSAERKVSEELCGRDERYAFFAELAQKLNAKIATAHTASDNAETLLFNLTRGMSVMGAGGIPPKRGNIIRPLILCTRADIERYCAENGLDFVTDSTNLGDEYTRNKIRHRVIPALKELNPSFELAALRFCESAALAAQCISSQAESILRLAKTDYGHSADVLLRAAPAVLTEALALLCKRQADFTAEARHLELLTEILKSGGAVDLGEYTAVCKQGLLRFSPKTIKSKSCYLKFSDSFEFEYDEKNIVVRFENSGKELKELVLRTRQSGDRFTFAKRGVTKPLRKALNEKRVPDEARDSLLLICDGSTVLWCEALGYSKQGEALRETHKLSVIISKGAKTMHKDVERVLLSKEKLENIVKSLAKQIEKDYNGREFIMVGLLKGSIVFMAELMTKIDLDFRIDFMVASSYGGGTESSGKVKIVKDLSISAKDKDILIVEDIVDSGNTLNFVINHLVSNGAASVKVVTLCDKPDRRKVPLVPDYCGAVIPDEFIVGYGLDYDEKYRNLPYVGILKRSVYE